MKSGEIKHILVVLVSIGILTACSTIKVPTKEQPIADMKRAVHEGIAGNQQENDAIPQSVASALMPSLSVKSANKHTKDNDHFDISVDEVSAQQFFMGLVNGTAYNMIVDSGVKGTISLHLKNVTVPEVMDAMREAYGYEYRYTKLGYHVYASDVQTQIFSVNYLNVQRTGASQTEVSSGISSDINENDSGRGDGYRHARSVHGGPSNLLGNTGGEDQNTGSHSMPAGMQGGGVGTSNTAVLTQSYADFWGILSRSLHAIIGKEEGRSVVLNPQAGVVIVKAKPAELRDVAKYLDKIQNSTSRQVLIEAKIIEVTLNKSFQQGINWRVLTLQQQGNRNLKNTGFDAFGVPVLPTVPVRDGEGSGDMNNNFNAFTGSVSGNGFNGMIKLLSTQGDVQVLSSPRIMTVNNQKALIKVGQDEFFVTDVSSETTVTVAQTVAQDIQLTPFFSGISLDITPQIDDEGEVTLHVHPTVANVTDQNKRIQLRQTEVLNLPLALSQIRETDNVVHAKSGQVVVIGGLMSNSYADRNGMTPGFGRLPGLGYLFRDTERLQQKRELVVLLCPVVMNEKTATEQLEATQKELEGIGQQAKKNSKPVSIMHWFDKVE